MTSEETADTKDTNPSEKPPCEIPECCRHMMTQMMGRTGSDSPGILGRLMLRMMKTCCGRFAAKQSKAA